MSVYRALPVVGKVMSIVNDGVGRAHVLTSGSSFIAKVSSLILFSCTNHYNLSSIMLILLFCEHPLVLRVTTKMFRDGYCCSRN